MGSMEPPPSWQDVIRNLKIKILVYKMTNLFWIIIKYSHAFLATAPVYKTGYQIIYYVIYTFCLKMGILPMTGNKTLSHIFFPACTFVFFRCHLSVLCFVWAIWAVLFRRCHGPLHRRSDPRKWPWVILCTCTSKKQKQKSRYFLLNMHNLNSPPQLTVLTTARMR